MNILRNFVLLSFIKKIILQKKVSFQITNGKVLSFFFSNEKRKPIYLLQLSNENTILMCNKAQQVIQGLAQVIGNSVTHPAPQAHKAITRRFKLMNTDLNILP